jgi:hypothetical protein
MTTFEQLAITACLVMAGGFMGWLLYHAKHPKRKIPPRLPPGFLLPPGKTMADIRQMDEELLGYDPVQDAQIWAEVAALGRDWEWPTTPPSPEIYDQFNPRPWARRDR